jgi:xylan 1,4-beta-xylosidase
VIFEGTPLGLTEAPHLYKRDGWYYLLTAEGGTGWNHAVTMARSRDIAGPYELHPDTYILSSRARPDAPLQRAGHADLVETPDGQTYAGLSLRPPPAQSGALRDGPRDGDPADGLGRGRLAAHRRRPGPAEPDRSPRRTCRRIRFPWRRFGPTSMARICRSTSSGCGRPSPEELFSLTARPGWLRLYGRETYRQPVSPGPGRSPAAGLLLLGVDRDGLRAPALPAGGGAGLLLRRDKFHYLHVTHDETHGRHLRVMSALPDAPQADAFTDPVPLPPGPIHLRVEVDFERLRFAWSRDGKDWRWLPETFDASILSDEATAPGLPNFTGAFVGVACQDTVGRRPSGRLRLVRLSRTRHLGRTRSRTRQAERDERAHRQVELRCEAEARAREILDLHVDRHAVGDTQRGGRIRIETDRTAAVDISENLKLGDEQWGAPWKAPRA